MTSPLPISVIVRVYEELNDFLPQELRKRDVWRQLKPGSTVADLLENLAVPKQAVDLVLINGESAALDTELLDGDRASLYPVFESLDITSLSRLDHAPLRRPCFALEEGFEELAGLLRFLGFEAVMLSPLHGSSKEKTAAPNRMQQPGLILLCRTCHDPAYADWQHKLSPGSEEPWKQAVVVLRRLDLIESAGVFLKHCASRYGHDGGESPMNGLLTGQPRKLLQALFREKQKSR